MSDDECCDCSEICVAVRLDLSTTELETVDGRDWRNRVIWACVGDPSPLNDLNKPDLVRCSFLVVGAHPDQQIAQNDANTRQLWIDGSDGHLYGLTSSGSLDSFIWAKATRMMT